MTVRNIHDDWADINSILVSKSDIVCGTAADLNAQLFASNQIEVIDSLLIGANFIAGKIIKIPMDLQTLNSTQQPERAEVTVAFIAIDR
jgi:hypothetical protein